MDSELDRTQAELLKLSEALLLCQRELEQVREQQETWEEKFAELREENEKLANSSARLARAMAESLADSYWRERGYRQAMGVRDFLVARWPRLRKLLGQRPSPELADEMAKVRLIEASPLFDPSWYLERRPDVAAAGVHAAFHYLIHGGSEDSSPGPDFDVRAYRRKHPDLEAGTNPLLHYLQSRGE